MCTDWVASAMATKPLNIGDLLRVLELAGKIGRCDPLSFDTFLPTSVSKFLI